MSESPSSSKAVPDAEGLSHTLFLQEDLLARIQARLTTEPDAVELQVEQAHLLAELKRPKEAADIYNRAIQSRAPKYPLTSRAYSVLPFKGKTLPITVLLLVTPEWGNAPFRKYLDEQTFLTLQVIADFHDSGLPLPPHQLVINCISDADYCQTSLAAASALYADSNVPWINVPAEISATTRESNAKRLGTIPGVRTPKIATLAREDLAADKANAVLQQHGFSFPLLVRAPGYHTGLHFLRVETLQELTAAVANFPGKDISLIEFLDARSADGQIRKYRVMMIGGQPYPAHLAIAKDWKVHFFSSTTPEYAEQRAEDRNFLENMEQVLGARTMEALRRIQEMLNLDYAGIDFSIDANGNLLLFEANATMNVQPPDADEMWSYRRAPVQRIADAVRHLFFAKTFSRQSTSPTNVLRQFTLNKIEGRLSSEPENVALKIERARLLIEMERHDEAKDILLQILTQDATNLVALNNLAALLNIMGYHKAAQNIYREVVKLSPDNIKCRMNLAQTLRETAELEESRGHYETVLRQEPGHAGAHRGLAYVLKYLHEDAAAWEHRKLGTNEQVAPTLPVQQREDLPRLLVLSSPCGGNSPITRFLDKKTFLASYLVPDFHDPTAPLPPHQLVINAIGDSDHCGPSLDSLAPILEKTTKPMLNPPDRVRNTGRAEIAQILRSLEGVVTPHIVTLSREVLIGSEGPTVLEEHGFTFPILIRTPGFHEGNHFVRVEKPEDLASAVAALPGQKHMAIQYLDARDGDGKIRKYRVMMVDGKLYPLHKAVSRKWMIHYYSAEMAHSPEHRTEDEAFLVDMPSVLGPRAMAALERIQGALGLDYAGADFSLGSNGEVLLFEANATMSVPSPDKGEKWDYRRSPVERIQAAVQNMILTRAGASSV